MSVNLDVESMMQVVISCIRGGKTLVITDCENGVPSNLFPLIGATADARALTASRAAGVL